MGVGLQLDMSALNALLAPQKMGRIEGPPSQGDARANAGGPGAHLEQYRNPASGRVHGAVQELAQVRDVLIEQAQRTAKDLVVLRALAYYEDALVQGTLSPPVETGPVATPNLADTSSVIVDSLQTLAQGEDQALASAARDLLPRLEAADDSTVSFDGGPFTDGAPPDDLFSAIEWSRSRLIDDAIVGIATSLARGEEPDAWSVNFLKAAVQGAIDVVDVTDRSTDEVVEATPEASGATASGSSSSDVDLNDPNVRVFTGGGNALDSSVPVFKFAIILPRAEEAVAEPEAPQEEAAPEEEQEIVAEDAVQVDGEQPSDEVAASAQLAGSSNSVLSGEDIDSIDKFLLALFR